MVNNFSDMTFGQHYVLVCGSTFMLCLYLYGHFDIEIKTAKAVSSKAMHKDIAK